MLLIWIGSRKDRIASLLWKWAAILLALYLPLGYPADAAGLTFSELEVSKMLFFSRLRVTHGLPLVASVLRHLNVDVSCARSVASELRVFCCRSTMQTVGPLRARPALPPLTALSAHPHKSVFSAVMSFSGFWCLNVGNCQQYVWLPGENY